MKLLKNVFISAGDNSLKLVDIHFDQRIQKIVQKLDRLVLWNDIDSPAKKNLFSREISFAQDPYGSTDYKGEFKFIMPGAIDSHVHFNTPGFEEREDFEHGSRAAAKGGVTTVIDMPCTSIPPVTSKKNFDIKKETIHGRSLVDYAFWGGIRGNDFSNGTDIQKQIDELAKEGVAGFKLYCLSGMNSFKDLTIEQILQAANCVKHTGLPIAVHAEDKYLVNSRVEQFVKQGRNDWEAYCQSRDVQAETKAISDLIEIAEKTDTKVHIVHLSSKPGLDLIKKAINREVKITVETCPHYLYFTQKEFANPLISAYLKTAPPVKFEEDKEALWQGLADNTLSFVTTDHAGCDPLKEKSSSNFWDVYGGIPGVEHRVPFLLSEGFKKGRITLSRTVELLSETPANYFNLQEKGSLNLGKQADMVLVNLWDSEKIDSKNMQSKGKYTPFEATTFDAVVERTYLRGKVLINNFGKPEADIGFGEFIQTIH